MDAKKLKDFTKTTVETYTTMSGGERKRFRELLKRHDTYIRHVQRFNLKGDFQNAILHDVGDSSRGVLSQMLNAGSNNGEGTPSSDAGTPSGEKVDGSGADRLVEGAVCGATGKPRTECNGCEGEGTEAQRS